MTDEHHLQVQRSRGALVRTTAYLLFALLTGEHALGDARGTAGPTSGPDLIVSVNGVVRWGTADGITAYSVGMTRCNLGDMPLLSEVSPSSDHPVTTQNMYRIRPEGRIEHIGQSWVIHHFCALQVPLCRAVSGRGGMPAHPPFRAARHQTPRPARVGKGDLVPSG